MLKTYLKIAFRTFAKNPSYVFVNLAGLAVGLGCCIVAYLFFEFNAQFDRELEYPKGAFRLLHTQEIDGDKHINATVNFAMRNVLRNDIPGVKNVSRHLRFRFRIKVGENNFSPFPNFVDPEFFNLFKVKVIKGDLRRFNEPLVAILSEETAKIYFGDENPIGKTFHSIKADKNDEKIFEVIAIVEDMPGNSSFDFDIILPFSNFLDDQGWSDDEWLIRYRLPGTFFELDFPERRDEVEATLQQYVKQSNEINPTIPIVSYSLDPVEGMARRNNDIGSTTTRSTIDTSTLITFGSMAGLILLIACFNFTNTTISYSGNRLKEIGVRKVLGSIKKSLIVQFMIENVLICFFAILLAIVLAELIILPQFNLLWGSNFEIDYLGNALFFSFLAIALLATAIIAGSYPAFYLSSFSPSNILRGSSKLKGTNFLLNSLLVFQFSLSLIGIIAGIVFYFNSVYIENFDEGYNKENLLWFFKEGNYDLIKSEVLNQPDIVSYGLATQHIGTMGYGTDMTVNDRSLRVRVLSVGENYLETMGVEFVEGRNYNFKMGYENQNSIVVTEDYVDKFNIKDPIGQVVRYTNHPGKLTIVGVVKDFYPGGIWSQIQPTIIPWRPDSLCGMVAVRTREGMIDNVTESMEASWKEIMPDVPFEVYPQSWISDGALNYNSMATKTFLFIAVICIILTSAGLFAIVNLIISKRIKEVGVRKVLGATIPHILLTINRPFISILGFAAILGCVASYFILEQILDEMFTENHIAVGFIPLFIGIIIIVTVAVLTIGRRVMKAATSNPVLALKYE